MEHRNTRIIVTYSNPIEEKRKKDAALYALEHPEVRVEDKKYSFAISSEDDLMSGLRDACTRRIHTWSQRLVNCDIEIIGEENEKEGTLLYGFFKYTQVISFNKQANLFRWRTTRLRLNVPYCLYYFFNRLNFFYCNKVVRF